MLDQPQGARPLPAHLQPSPQFIVGHIQVALRLLHARVAEHQMDDADVDAVSKEARGALVTQIVPVQIDGARMGGTCEASEESGDPDSDKRCQGH